MGKMSVNIESGGKQTLLISNNPNHVGLAMTKYNS